METDANLQVEPLIWRVLNFLHRYLCIFLRLIMVKLYDERGQSMTPIDDRLLLEPATVIAEKIRTKQVRIFGAKQHLQNFKIQISESFRYPRCK